jgi:hypothetical protein
MDTPLKINMERAGTSVHDMSPLGRCEPPFGKYGQPSS